MNLPDTNMQSTPPKRTVFTAALRIFGALPQVFSVVLSFAVVAYAVGWFQARAYFRSFGADWLLPQLGAFDLLRFSWTPLLLLAFFMWLGLTDLAETGERRDSRRFRITVFVLRHGWWTLFVLLIATYALEALGYGFAAVASAIFTMVGFVFFAGAVFEAIVMHVREGRFVGDLSDAQLVYGVVVAGLYFVPTLYGTVEGKMAADPTRSELPIIQTSRANDPELRLILMSEGTAYAAELGDGTKSNIKIHLLPMGEIQAILRKSNKDRAEASTPFQTTPSPTMNP